MTGRSVGFVSVLVTTMGASTFGLAVYAVLAADLIDAFGVDRWQVGALVTATALAGAVASPIAGVFADRAGARVATVTTLIGSGIALGAIAVAPAYWLLVAAALASGVAQAIANPSTNKLIAHHVPLGRRGVITGIKQSGVQFGTFLAGATLPALAAAFAWSGAVVVYAGAAIAAGVVAALILPTDPTHDAASGAVAAFPADAGRYIRRIAAYGFLLGAGGTAIFTYLPLFASESLGFSQGRAGAVVAVSGLVGIGGRVAWGRMAEVRFGTRRALTIIAWAAVVTALVLALSTALPALVWLAALGTGLSVSAWNAVGMLAVIESVPAAGAGRASGIVLFGFLSGLGLGAPVMGWTVDRLGDYRPGWIAIAVAFGSATWLVRPRAEPRPARA